MFNYGNRTSLCLVLLFVIMGSITMMLFLKNKDIGVKQVKLPAEKTRLSQKIDKEIKEVIAKGKKVIPEIKQKMSDVPPTLGNIKAKKAKADELKGKREDNSITLAKQNQSEMEKDSETYTEGKVKENPFTSDLNEILESEVLKDDGENESSTSDGKRVALEINPEVIQEELRNLYKKRIEVLTYLE